MSVELETAEPQGMERIVGPRLPADELRAHPRRYLLPVALFVGAAAVLVVSVFLPYWHLQLEAPQYPEGLQVDAYVNRLVGDVGELESLNHYVGLPSFEHGATFERSISVIGIVTLAALLGAAALVRNRKALYLALPALLFPLVFLADLQYWLWRYGHDLDPRAPFSGAVGEFTPPVLGPAQIAQFETVATPGPGLLLAAAASVLVAVGLWYHRKAFKPLVEQGAGEDAG